jgi:CRISPR-associated endonuclease/helicase Cas3
MNRPELTSFQSKVQDLLKHGKSVLLVAPTGLGKTLAVTADIQDKFTKTIYAVPLRALGVGIRDAISELRRGGKPIEPKIHHGDTQESLLFSEEVVVTTYDQVVCGVPGLPLSLPLKAGHAVAGALLMSRLILDEVHLAWGISSQALSILLAIIDFRRKLGLQTVVQTATLPGEIARLASKEMDLELIIVGEADCKTDEGLALREKNRKVSVFALPLETKRKGEGKTLDHASLDEKLTDTSRKRIYFANTVGRLQETYDRLVAGGVPRGAITVLHNRMPGSWRQEAEKQAMDRFGKCSPEGKWLLLTNQVSEAGLDISASLVISDPAPVDTLVQRAGRCARWFRKGHVQGEFFVIKVPTSYMKDWASPYREKYVAASVKTIPDKPQLTWDVEKDWINNAWGLELDAKNKMPNNAREKQKEQIERALAQTPFALNLFDRSAQERKPGEIAREFREILSVEIAVEDSSSTRDLQNLVDSRQYPETSSVSAGQAWQFVRNSKSNARAIRYEEGALRVTKADYVRPGDVIVVSSEVAVLHRDKGLCLEKLDGEGVVRQSDWKPNEATDKSLSREGGRPQTLLNHTLEVMKGTYERLMSSGAYRDTLVRIVKSLEPQNDESALANTIAQIATVSAGFHDLGKADQKWQAKAREIDPQCHDGLVGRTANTRARIGIPHTPPGFAATVKACEILMGYLDSAEHLIRSIALAAARHHSSLTNPALVEYTFEPDPKAQEFVEQILKEVGAAEEVRNRAHEILDAAQKRPAREMVPLALPNDDLFPIYALVGRAILMADRTSAAGQELEQWS